MDRARDPLFEHYPITPELVEKLTERMGPECHTHRVKNGQKLQWRFGKFTLGKGKNSKRESRAYAVYVNNANQPVDPSGSPISVDFKRLPVLEISCPPAPTRGIWVRTRGALKPPPNTTRPTEKSAQSIDLDHTSEDVATYPHWVAFCRDMQKFFRDLRCEALVKHVAEHDYFDDDFRSLAESNPESAIERLLMAHDDANNNSQNPCRFWNANRVMFRERREDGNMMRISPRDEEILKIPGFDPIHESGPFEGKPVIRNFLETSSKFWELNLMKISLPSKGCVVEPSEYDRLNSGGIATVEISVYGMYERIDGKKRQIGVSVANTGASILNNGPKTKKESACPDVMDLLTGKRPQEPACDSPSKKPRLAPVPEECPTDPETEIDDSQ